MPKGNRSTSRFQRCETSCLDWGRFSSRGIHFIVPNSENDCPDHWEMRSIFSKTERAAKSLRERRMRSAASGGRLAAEREGARSGRMAFLARKACAVFSRRMGVAVEVAVGGVVGLGGVGGGGGAGVDAEAPQGHQGAFSTCGREVARSDPGMSHRAP